MKYKIIKDGVFPANFKKGAQILLDKKKAADFVKKGWVEPVKTRKKKESKTESENGQTKD